MDKIANCNNCGQSLEFDASMANSLIDCPSCGVETKLTEVDYHPEPKLTKKTAHKAEEQVASGAHNREQGKDQADSPKSPRLSNIIPPRLSNIIPPGLANKIDATIGGSKLTRQVGWICTVFGLLTFMSQFIRFVALNVTYKNTWSMLEKNLLLGIRMDEVFTHCALGLIIAGLGVLLLELNNIYKK